MEKVLHFTARNGHLNILLRSGANVNARNISNSTPLHLSIKHSFEEIVEILIKNKAV
ncbi:ankyrin repeat domain-containing protein [Candidatus Mesenet endosymbiont of Phosphuga atrata]|uniref:ankyrin repeat domain-containing protein n=1 Tax=Candidatus Mesenet endosymbiont of Phosphuga atrata TaxID=3066221 RepID=UPI003977DE79